MPKVLRPKAHLAQVTVIVTLVLAVAGCGSLYTELGRLKGGPASTTVIDSALVGATALDTGDLDGDGDIDVVSGSFEAAGSLVWYANDGSGSFGPATLINSGLDGIADLYITDADGDGDNDIFEALSGAGEISFYENDGAGNFTRVLIDSNPVSVRGVHAGDITANGFQDVVIAADDTVSYYGYDGSVFGTRVTLSPNALGASSVFTGDFDADSPNFYIDVISGSVDDDRLAGYPNGDLGPGSFFPGVDLATGVDAFSVYAADLDGDTDPDLISVSRAAGRVIWVENQGSGTFSTANEVTNGAGDPVSVRAADLDNDGDNDLLVASSADNRILRYDNDGSGSFGAAVEITASAGAVSKVRAADLDGDGDLDVVATQTGDSSVVWYPNLLIP